MSGGEAGRCGLHRRGLLVAAALAAAGVRAAPVFRWPEPLRLLDGRTLAAADWQDCAAVVVLFATWCPFCQRHNAHVEALHRAHAGPHLRVLGAALDRDEVPVREYLRRHGYGFPVTMQAEALRAAAGVREVLPTTIPVGRDGRMRMPLPGEMFREDVLEFARLAEMPALPR